MLRRIAVGIAGAVGLAGLGALGVVAVVALIALVYAFFITLGALFWALIIMVVLHYATIAGASHWSYAQCLWPWGYIVAIVMGVLSGNRSSSNKS